jgi:hypothetical protein
VAIQRIAVLISVHVGLSKFTSSGNFRVFCNTSGISPRQGLAYSFIKFDNFINCSIFSS